jgi:hypothetical protein
MPHVAVRATFRYARHHRKTGCSRSNACI